MARRSQTNARYQKYTEPKGKTRKSAAAAKPTRKEGSCAAEKAKPKTKTSAASKYNEPDTPEYKRWRRVWWGSLLAGIVLISISLAIQYLLHGTGVLSVISALCVGASYATLIIAFVVDYFKLRPIRNAANAPAPAPADKAAKLAAAKDADERTTADSSPASPDTSDPADIGNHQ